ncbi:MAG TPA: hypothetical protein PK890_11355, partial [Terrimesophilobacter sp.]|nr:hypothetical protein [Terrimesophilobacter sp.]
MPEVFDVVLATLLIIAGSIWIGGYVTVVVVSLVSARALEPDARVLFFRRFGAAYFWVSTPALLVALGIGWVFLARLPWSDELTRMAVASVVLVVILIGGIIQARNLTRLRERSAAT